jgi:hypothetical protein
MKSKPANKMERKRFERLAEHGCICCKHHGHYRAAEIHHITECRKRLGHDYTLPLCEWHHRGIPPEPLGKNDTARLFGPSLAQSKREFQICYGTERELLQEIDSWLYGATGEEETRDSVESGNFSES